MNQLKAMNKKYIANSCVDKDFLKRVKREYDIHIDFYHRYCHFPIKVLEEFLYSIPIENSENFFHEVRLKINHFVVLDIITRSSLTNKYSKYDSKQYQYLRDYNGRIKVIAKQNPPSIQKGSKRNTENFKSYDRKLYNSISRSKQTVYELALCNDWKYFVTFTINKNYYDRHSLHAFIKAFMKWLSNYSARKTNGIKIQYVLIPEIDKKGAWHLHGLMNGIPQDHLSPFEPEQHSKRLANKEYLNWDAYEKKFGYCSLSEIRSIEKVTGYITKSITKSSTIQKRPLNSKLYYCSQGLARSTEIGRGYNLVSVDQYDYEDEHVGTKWLTDTVTSQS